MASSAYKIIQDGSTTLPKDNGDIDTDFKFSAPGLDDSVRTVLLFQVNPAPDPSVTLEATLNGESVLTVDFSTDPQRAWHEVIPAGVLQESGNILTLTKTGGGSVTVSDLFVLYQLES